MNIQAFSLDCKNPNRSDEVLKLQIKNAQRCDDLPDEQIVELIVIIKSVGFREHLLEAVLRPILRPHSPIV
ncbi:MAG: hypothetical protein AAB515_00085 [Patescibacteria group bacterium]